MMCTSMRAIETLNITHACKRPSRWCVRVQAHIRRSPDADKPPSKRRKLQPLQPTPFVDSRRLGTKRYPKIMRRAMADLVHQYLPQGSQERAWADEGHAHLINFEQYRRRNHQSPIAAADRDMCARYPESFAARAPTTRYDALRTWFVHIRSPVACQRRRWQRARLAPALSARQGAAA